MSSVLRLVAEKMGAWKSNTRAVIALNV